MISSAKHGKENRQVKKMAKANPVRLFAVIKTPQ